MFVELRAGVPSVTLAALTAHFSHRSNPKEVEPCPGNSYAEAGTPKTAPFEKSRSSKLGEGS